MYYTKKYKGGKMEHEIKYTLHIFNLFFKQMNKKFSHCLFLKIYFLPY